jgi:hypothetical protein
MKARLELREVARRGSCEAALPRWHDTFLVLTVETPTEDASLKAFLDHNATTNILMERVVHAKSHAKA